MDRILDRILACRWAEGTETSVPMGLGVLRPEDRDHRSISAIEIARRYAVGQATAEELRSAWDAAWDAVDNAVGNAARQAARAAAFCCCSDAGDAARAAGDAARAACGTLGCADELAAEAQLRDR